MSMPSVVRALQPRSRCAAGSLLAGLLLLPVAAAAQERPAEEASIATPTRYRDGERWLDVSRLGHDAHGEHVRIVTGRFDFEAWVGATALLRRRDHALPTTTELAARGLVLDRVLAPSIGLVSARAEGEDGLDIAARLGRDAELEVVPDLLLPRAADAITIPPDDPRYAGQRYLERIEIESAWAVSSGDAATTIAVIDTGCDLTHPDLSYLPGYDAFANDDDPTPPPATEGNAHGTECAGIAGAIGDNGEGIAGTCPECTVRCVRLLPGGADLIPVSADVVAFQHAIDWNVAVVSNSWGFRDPVVAPGPLRDILTATQTMGRGGLGAVVVFAAGNEARELMPGELYDVPGVITVGGINVFDEAVPYSNFGSTVDLTAPLGALTTDITGADGSDPGDYTSSFSGTSSACPVVSGVAALVASAYPTASATEIHDAILASVRPARFATPDASGHDPLYGYGIVDPLGALAQLGPVPMDAGIPDAGTIDAGTTPPEAGCGCRAGGGTSPASLAVLLLLSLTLSWRRR